MVSPQPASSKIERGCIPGVVRTTPTPSNKEAAGFVYRPTRDVKSGGFCCLPNNWLQPALLGHAPGGLELKGLGETKVLRVFGSDPSKRPTFFAKGQGSDLTKVQEVPCHQSNSVPIWPSCIRAQCMLPELCMGARDC